MQNVQTQMRANRNDQAALIYANMQCPIERYPVGMALSDLESYYRAGTLTSGLVNLSRTVTKAETDSKASKDSKAPASPPAAKAQLQMTSKVAESKTKASDTCPRA